MIKPATRPINPAKLHLSKWTAAQPVNKEKHFLVTRIIKDDSDIIVACVVEAVLTGKEYEIDWRALQNTTYWLAGWL
ncbi:MAG: TIGR02450 family Trp-rich protein [Methylovulum sp.]|nr:TIGR02450 family Trp-rich protein [Methylovulum sp.]